MRTSPSSGRVATASRVRHSCTLTAKRGRPEPSSDTRRSEWARRARSLKFQICLARVQVAFAVVFDDDVSPFDITKLAQAFLEPRQFGRIAGRSARKYPADVRRVLR